MRCRPAMQLWLLCLTTGALCDHGGTIFTRQEDTPWSLPPSAPASLCFAFGGDEWCGTIRPGSLRRVRETLRRKLAALAARSVPDELLTAVREGAYGPLYPLELLAAAPSLFAPPPGSAGAALPLWVVTISSRAGEPFANHSDPTKTVSFASLAKGRGSGTEYDDAAAELLAQMQRHGWARLHVPQEHAALVRSLERTARTFFGLADNVKEQVQKTCPFTGKFWGWAREQKLLANGQAAIFPREYFMVRKEIPEFSSALPWDLTPGKLQGKSRAAFNLLENVSSVCLVSRTQCSCYDQQFLPLCHNNTKHMLVVCTKGSLGATR